MITLHDLCAHLLPPEEHVKFTTLILDEQRIILVAAMTAPKAACPDCSHLGFRVHSGYQQTLADLPWATAPMQLRLHVRRFFCPTCTCGRVTFTERLPTVAAWLEAHPTVRIVARDRSDASASGIRQGAPDALQVADRFHLVQHVAEALQEVFSAQSQDLAALSDTESREPVTREDGTVAVPIAPPVPAPAVRDQAVQRRERRRATYEQVWSLHLKGWTAQAIAAHVGIRSRTVFRYVRTSSTFPERHPRRQLSPTVLEPFTAPVRARWNEGCRNAAQIFREITLQGFRGQYAPVARYARRLRTAQGSVPTAAQPTSPPPVIEAPQPLTPRGATWLVIRREENLDEEAMRQRAQLHEQEGEIAEAIALTHGLTDLVRQRQPEGLDAWLERATASCLAAFARFARGLRDDYEAVKAGLTLPWSTGPVEGHINRLKMRKRQMFGRANIALLRLRVLYKM